MLLTIFFALGSGILISFKLTSLKLIQIFAKIGNNIIEKLKKLLVKVMYMQFFFLF